VRVAESHFACGFSSRSHFPGSFAKHLVQLQVNIDVTFLVLRSNVVLFAKQFSLYLSTLVDMTVRKRSLATDQPMKALRLRQR